MWKIVFKGLEMGGCTQQPATEMHDLTLMYIYIICTRFPIKILNRNALTFAIFQLYQFRYGEHSAAGHNFGMI